MAALSIQRRRKGHGFSYFDQEGQRIKNPNILRRLRALTIPPMWEKVKISDRPRAKLQAVGRDAKGRKQYIYHPYWENQRQREKFSRVLQFGQALPKMRRRCHDLLLLPKWPKEKVLALMVLILDETGIRIGNQQYLNNNQTYGLSTLRRRHLNLEDDALIFHFRGKSRQDRQVRIEDEELMGFIRRAAEQPGYEIFRYRESGHWHSVDSDEINSFIQKQMGAPYSSKDFRTWVACRLAVDLYPQAVEIKQKNSRKRISSTLLRLVSQELGNTPTICRDYYIHPRLFSLIKQQALPLQLADEADSPPWEHSGAEKLIIEKLLS
ncbi:MAG: DNA topoisomerase IB [Bacteroidota bacterium]